MSMTQHFDLFFSNPKDVGHGGPRVDLWASNHSTCQVQLHDAALGKGMDHDSCIIFCGDIP